MSDLSKLQTKIKYATADLILRSSQQDILADVGKLESDLAAALEGKRQAEENFEKRNQTLDALGFARVQDGLGLGKQISGWRERAGKAEAACAEMSEALKDCLDSLDGRGPKKTIKRAQEAISCSPGSHLLDQLKSSEAALAEMQSDAKLAIVALKRDMACGQGIRDCLVLLEEMVKDSNPGSRLLAQLEASRELVKWLREKCKFELSIAGSQLAEKIKAWKSAGGE